MSMPPYQGAGGGYYPPPVDNTPYVPFAGPGPAGPVGDIGFAGAGAPHVGAPGYPGAAPAPGVYPAGGYPAPGVPPVAGGYPGVPPVAGGYPAGAAAPYGPTPGIPPANPGYGMAPTAHYGAPQHSMMSMGPGGKQIYHVSVSAVGLKSRDGLFSKSDPYCVLYKSMGGRGGWQRVGRTETLKNNPSPHWTHKFVVDVPPGQVTGVNLKFEVWDEDRGTDNIMETVEVSLDTILAHPGMRYEAHLGRSSWTASQGGMMTITAQPAAMGGQPMGGYPGSMPPRPY